MLSKPFLDPEQPIQLPGLVRNEKTMRCGKIARTLEKGFEVQQRDGS